MGVNSLFEPEVDRGVVITVAVVAAAAITLAWGVYSFTHLDALVFRTEGEYDESATVRALGTWAVLPAALTWLWLLRVVRRWPHDSVRARWVRPLASATVVALPIVVSVAALPFTGVFE